VDLAGRPGQASVPCRKTFHGKNMTEPVDLQNDQARSAFAAGAEASLESVLCTEELVGRPSRPPDYQKENGALVSLSNALADSSRTVLQTLADTILDVCRSGSAGVSLLTTDDGGKSSTGRRSRASGSHTSAVARRAISAPAATCLIATPFAIPASRPPLHVFQPVLPPVEEALLVPFYVGGKAVGTIWAVAHDFRCRFDAEDERLMTSLGKFASSAYQILVSLDALK